MLSKSLRKIWKKGDVRERIKNRIAALYYLILKSKMSSCQWIDYAFNGVIDIDYIDDYWPLRYDIDRYYDRYDIDLYFSNAT